MSAQLEASEMLLRIVEDVEGVGLSGRVDSSGGDPW
jgi:hypothetical protein